MEGTRNSYSWKYAQDGLVVPSSIKQMFMLPYFPEEIKSLVLIAWIWKKVLKARVMFSCYSFTSTSH